MANEQLLFSVGELDGALDAAKAKLHAEVLAADEGYLLNVDIDEWVAHCRGNRSGARFLRAFRGSRPKHPGVSIARR